MFLAFEQVRPAINDCRLNLSKLTILSVAFIIRFFQGVHSFTCYMESYT